MAALGGNISGQRPESHHQGNYASDEHADYDEGKYVENHKANHSTFLDC
jgi:hypothetical protein